MDEQEVGRLQLRRHEAAPPPSPRPAGRSAMARLAGAAPHAVVVAPEAAIEAVLAIEHGGGDHGSRVVPGRAERRGKDGHVREAADRGRCP